MRVILFDMLPYKIIILIFVILHLPKGLEKLTIQFLLYAFNTPRLLVGFVLLFPICSNLNRTYENNLNHQRSNRLFDDPDLWQQWYFVKKGNYPDLLSHDLNLVWEMGISGKGVTIGLVGGGINKEHRDLKENYNKNLSFNFLSNSSDISSCSYECLTESAGLVSAVSGNGQCGVGAAPSSNFAILQIYDDEQTILDNKIVTMALGYRRNDIQIYLIKLNFYSSINLTLARVNNRINSLENSLTYGKEIPGSIFITGSGDSGIAGSNCGFSNYLQDEDMFVFGAISINGYSPAYSEKCTSILAATLSSLHLRRTDNIYSTTWGNLCENAVGGTTASSSIAAGIIALLVEKNPLLTARQIMILIIKTSTQYDGLSVQNAAGFHYSYSFGFGMLNAAALIKLSSSDEIVNLTEQHLCKTFKFNKRFVSQKHRKLVLYVYTSGCFETKFCITAIEQMFLIFKLHTHKRSSITIYLTSPKGTKFKIIAPRMNDISNQGFSNWKVKILGYYGENPIGIWSLEIFCSDGYSYVKRVELMFYGTCVATLVHNMMLHVRVKGFILKKCLNKQKLFPLFRMCKNVPSSFYEERFVDIYSFIHESLPPFLSIVTLGQYYEY